MSGSVSMDALREGIAGALWRIKSYNLPAVCARLGLPNGDGREPHASKMAYVRARLVSLGRDDLLRTARDVLAEVNDPELADLLDEISTSVTNRISEVTRKDVLVALNLFSPLFGGQDIIEGLNIVTTPPLDRDWLHLDIGLPTKGKGVYQHFIRNNDWTNDEVLTHCGAMTCSQPRFFRLLERLLDPAVRKDDDQAALVAALGPILKRDGFCVAPVGEVSGYPVYAVQRLSVGVPGSPKNLIFGSTGPKPDLILRDAINNDIGIVANAEFCLIYDRPLSTSGLAWTTMAEWWMEREGLPDIRSAKNGLYKRLLQAVVATNSPGEAALFKTYFKLFPPRLGDRLPALIPQVYLHFDPKNLFQRGGNPVLKRQRMDLLLLLENNVRVVLEVDGRQHYTDGDDPSPERYAEMAAEDRRLRLAGYEVYRFGGAEFPDTPQTGTGPTVGHRSKAVAESFFEGLLTRHKVLHA